MKKSIYKVLAEAIAFDGFKDFKVPTDKIDYRRLTVNEIKEFMKEEFGDVKKFDMKDAKEEPKGWGDADLEKELDWVKTLDLKEFFKPQTNVSKSVKKK